MRLRKIRSQALTCFMVVERRTNKSLPALPAERRSDAVLPESSFAVALPLTAVVFFRGQVAIAITVPYRFVSVTRALGSRSRSLRHDCRFVSSDKSGETEIVEAEVEERVKGQGLIIVPE